MSMVEGYNSSVTVAHGLRNVLLVWILPAAAMIVLGALAIVKPDATWIGSSFASIATTLRIAVGFLSLVTTIASIVWMVRVWSNVRRVGKRAKVGALDLFKRHVGFVLLGMALLIGSVFSGNAAPILALAGGVLLWIGVSFIPFLILAAMRLFWRAGSPPIGLEEELPHYGIVWFASWFGYSSMVGIAEVPELPILVASALIVLQGIACLVAAVTGARLVVEIAERQDERLQAIINQLGSENDREKTVTSSQIESAWENSEGLVSFQH